MSSSTPNLNLVLPVGSEHVSRAIINENNTKIDTGFHTLSEQIGAINTALRPSNANWINNANANNYTTTGQFLIGSGGTNFPDGWGILTVIANRQDIILQEYERANIIYLREFRDNAWSAWQQLAKASETYILTGGTTIPENANIDTYTTPGKYGTRSSQSARTMSGLPFPQGSASNFAFNLIVENSALDDTYARRQVLQFFNDPAQWVRYGTTSSWSTGWVKTAVNAESVTFTPESGVTNHLFVRKYGRVVTVNGYLEKSTAFSDTVENIGTFSAGNRPAAAVRFMVAISNAAYNVGEIGYGVIGADGILAIKAKSGNTYKTCYFSVSYIIEG